MKICPWCGTEAEGNATVCKWCFTLLSLIVSAGTAECSIERMGKLLLRLRHYSWLRCKQCDHAWQPRRIQPPKVCPRCKTKNWK
jgi:rubrerythrin